VAHERAAPPFRQLFQRHVFTITRGPESTVF
jgi:hypothetical protein